MVNTDVLIIGAGLLGCFAARNLSKYAFNVTVLEKENDVCRGISKANAGIIYPGYDQYPGSEKQELCKKANKKLDRLMMELDVPYKRTGSLLVGYGPRSDAVIRKKYRNGMENGIKDISIISGSEAEKMEPALMPGISSALLSTSTATVNPWELCIAAYENAAANGVGFRFNSMVTGMRREGSGFIAETEDETFRASAVINTAGLLSDKVREFLQQPLIRIFPTAADFIVLDKGTGSLVNHIIFHEKEDGKGLTLVPTVDDNLLIGPSNRATVSEDELSPGMETSSRGLDSLKELCKMIAPGIDLDRQIRSFGSLRPDSFYVSEENGVISKEEKSIRDITILEEEGLFSLIGIKTPGLTISDELGKLIAKKVAQFLGKSELKKDFYPVRKAIIRARDLSYEERASLIQRDPGYGEIVCSCMDVTLAEVRSAKERGAGDLESIKRRTGAIMGRCQGSRCRKRIMEI